MTGPRVLQVDPSAFTPPYDRALSAALARAGAEVELATSHFPYGPVPPAVGYEVRELFYRRAHRLDPSARARLPLKAAEHLPGMARLARRAREADLIHYQWLTFPRADRALLPRRRPRVYTLHYPLPAVTDTRGLEVQRRVLSRFDSVVVHTSEGARRLRDDLGLDPTSVEVIPHGAFDYLTRLPTERPLPPELEGAEGPVILFFGLLRPYKGIDVLLEAFAELEGAELWICGMPRMDITAVEAAAGSSDGRIRLLPRFITDAEIPAIMRRADVVVLPYREIEQSGVLYASLAFGKPIVLSRVGGFAEVIDRGAAAGVTPGDAEGLREALGGLIADPGARETLAGRAGELIAGEYSWDAIAERTLDLYGRLLAAGRG